MKKFLLIAVDIIAFLPFIIFFEDGSNVSIHMIPVIFILSLINTFLSQSLKDFLIRNLLLGIFNIAGILASSLLYFIFICYDGIGVGIMWIEVSVAFVYVILLTVIGLIIKGIIKKCRKNK